MVIKPTIDHLSKVNITDGTWLLLQSPPSHSHSPIAMKRRKNAINDRDRGEERERERNRNKTMIFITKCTHNKIDFNLWENSSNDTFKCIYIYAFNTPIKCLQTWIVCRSDIKFKCTSKKKWGAVCRFNFIAIRLQFYAAQPKCFWLSYRSDDAPRTPQHCILKLYIYRYIIWVIIIKVYTAYTTIHAFKTSYKPSFFRF